MNHTRCQLFSMGEAPNGGQVKKKLGGKKKAV
jgi:hypothetical protein